MFQIRKRKPKNPERQIFPVQLEITVEHEHLPPLEEDWSKRWCTVSNDFKHSYEKVFNFEVRVDDVFVVTGMKSGTIWMLETVWLLLNNLDYAKAKEISIAKRTGHVEMTAIRRRDAYNSVEICNEMTSPRIIKSHLPASMLPKQCWKQKSKIIYVARNLKDVVVSAYNFFKEMGWWTGTIDEYIEDLINDDLMYTPYFSHILDFWKLRHEPNIFFVTYEEMKRDLAGVVQKLCNFMERPELTSEELQETLKHLSFENMKDHSKYARDIRNTMPVVSENFQFMRRGVVGSYKDELSPKLQEKLNKWSEEILSKHKVREEDIFGTF